MLNVTDFVDGFPFPSPRYIHITLYNHYITLSAAHEILGV
jgi:hypothetical protein